MRYEVSVIENIISNNERKKLLVDCQDYLHDIGEDFPGLQTQANLHNHYEFFDVIVKMTERVSKVVKKDLKPARSWVNCDGGHTKNLYWHNHKGYDYSMVYYMKTQPLLRNSGTLFANKFVRVPQNGAIIFPSFLDHTAPTYIFPWTRRYTLAIDFKCV